MEYVAVELNLMSVVYVAEKCKMKMHVRYLVQMELKLTVPELVEGAQPWIIVVSVLVMAQHVYVYKTRQLIIIFIVAKHNFAFRQLEFSLSDQVLSKNHEIELLNQSSDTINVGSSSCFDHVEIEVGSDTWCIQWFG